MNECVFIYRAYHIALSTFRTTGARIGVGCSARQNTLRSFQSPLAELRGHYGLREAIPKLRFAPVSRNLF